MGSEPLPLARVLWQDLQPQQTCHLQDEAKPHWVSGPGAPGQQSCGWEGAVPQAPGGAPVVTDAPSSAPSGPGEGQSWRGAVQGRLSEICPERVLAVVPVVPKQFCSPLVNVWGTLGQGEGPLPAVGFHLLGAETGELDLGEGGGEP